MTLNMLRASNVRPTISAHTYIYGMHDYNHTPLAPLGCATQCYLGPTQRLTFGAHGAHSMDSWYIGTSTENYRCQRVLMKKTRAVQITDTIVFHHKHITNPTMSKADAITSAAATLTETIKANMKTNLKSIDIKELKGLAKIFEEAAESVSEKVTS
eukprot:scaffold40539_cov45-Cyclotella_meneghiniana.AAC.3